MPYLIKTLHNKYMIVLASNSWLRKTIMDKSGLAYTSEDANIDERSLEKKHNNVSHEKLSLLLASTKAISVAKKHPNSLTVAADTFAVLPNGERLHKPNNHEQAINLCMKQSGKKMCVITGLAMFYKDTLLTNISKTYVEYINFSRAEIVQLLKSDNSSIRNAALGFFLDAPGFTLVSTFSGSYTGAMGLPMETLRLNIKKLGYKESL